MTTVATASSSTAAIRPTIVLFGDSLTQFGFGETPAAVAAAASPAASASSSPASSIGWASLLSATYSRRADVLSRGYSGYNTRHALDILPSVLRNCGAVSSAGGGSRTLFWTLWYGANDAALPAMRQHVPLAEYQDNIREMIGMIR